MTPQKIFNFSYLEKYIQYIKNSSVLLRFGFHDCKKNFLNLIPKSQIYTSGKEVTNSRGGEYFFAVLIP
jgi:hypothetical protein